MTRAKIVGVAVNAFAAGIYLALTAWSVRELLDELHELTPQPAADRDPEPVTE